MRSSRENRRLFRGSERTRLTTMVLMLVMLLVMISTIRNRPSLFSWLATAPETAADPVIPAPPEKQSGAVATDEPDLPPALKSALAQEAAKSAASTSDPAKSAPAKSDPAPSAGAKTAPPVEPAKSAATEMEPAKSPTSNEKTSNETTNEKTNDPPPQRAPTTPPKSLVETPTQTRPPADSDEFDEERLKELLSIVQDKTISIHSVREMPTQFLLLRMAQKKTLDQLREKARANPKFSEFYQRSAEHRGELVQFDMNVRLINKFELTAEQAEAAGTKQIYELWGPSDESGAWLYVANVSELPAGMPSEGPVEERVTIVGRYFKLLAYHERGAGPKARPLTAPIIVGKIAWHPVQRRVAQQDPPWLWAAVGGVVLVISIVFLWGVLRSRKQRIAKPAQDHARVADWLRTGPESASSGEPPTGFGGG